MAGLWQATWRAATAYTLTAVVMPTTFAGFTWRCTTAGTSGGTEPVWPSPTISPTIVDGGVTWSVGSGDRMALQAGILAVVQAFSAANPTIVRTVKTVRPPSFETTEMPLFFIDNLNEQVDTSQGVRGRTFVGATAYLVDQLSGDPYYSNDRMNFAADVFADLFSFNPHTASGYSLFQHTGTNDAAFDESGHYVALEFTFSTTRFLEGR